MVHHPWSKGLHRWHHPNHDDHDWLDPFFSLFFCHWGLSSQKVAKPWLLWRLLATQIVSCCHIPSPLSFLGLFRFVLGTAYQYAIMEILIGVIKIRFLKRLSITLMGMFASGLWSVLLCLESLFIYLTENSKSKPSKKSILANNREGWILQPSFLWNSLTREANII